MDEPVTIKYRWTVDELFQAYRYNFRHLCRPIFRFALNAIFVFMILGGSLLIPPGRSPVFGIVMLVGGIYWFAIRPFERSWTIRRRFAKRPDKDLEMEWQITPEKLATRSTAHSADLTWQLIAKVVRTPAGIMLYPIDQVFYWLPRHGFASDAEFERLVEIAKSKAPRVYDVG
jgi:hypothetical protein